MPGSTTHTTPHQRHHKINPTLLWVWEASRLTSRDRLLLTLPHEHRTLTTEQVAAIAFGTVGRARVRLSTLHSRGVLDRFRHYLRPGSQSWLGPSARSARLSPPPHGGALPRPSAVAGATARLSMSPTLGHLVGVNGFFTGLHAYARTSDHARLCRWWNEARCWAATGGIARPDAHGVWMVGAVRVAFWLEYDIGTEALHRVVAKVADYARMSGTRCCSSGPVDSAHFQRCPCALSTTGCSAWLHAESAGRPGAAR